MELIPHVHFEFVDFFQVSLFSCSWPRSEIHEHSFFISFGFLLDELCDEVRITCSKSHDFMSLFHSILVYFCGAFVQFWCPSQDLKFVMISWSFSLNFSWTRYIKTWGLSGTSTRILGVHLIWFQNFSLEPPQHFGIHKNFLSPAGISYSCIGFDLI